MTIPLRVDGVDISHHQSATFDYAAAKAAGVQFVYHKATEGTSFTDPNYARRRAEAKAAGLAFGAYHFARPEGTDAVAEAQHFLRVAAPLPGDLVPVLDLEVDGHMGKYELTEWSRVWVQTVVNALEVRPMIYTPFDLSSNFGCKLWVARYSNLNAQPRIPAPWRSADLRQFSDGVYGNPQSVAGFGRVDLNTFGTSRTLADFLIPAKVAPEPAPPKPAPKPPVKKPRIPAERLHVTISSMQNTDTVAQIHSDAKQLFTERAWGKHGLPHAIFLTESERRGRVGPIVAALAEKHGWHLTDLRGDVRILVRPDIRVRQEAYIHVLDGRGGRARGNYPDRGLVETFIETVPGNDIWLTGWHDNTGYELDRKPGHESERERNIALQVRHAASRIAEHAKGTALSIWGADMNVDEAVDRGADRDAPHAILRRHGLTSAYDELGRYPDTHGKKTYDIVGTADADGRIKAVDIVRWPARHSDHRRMSFLFDVAALR